MLNKPVTCRYPSRLRKVLSERVLPRCAWVLPLLTLLLVCGDAAAQTSVPLTHGWSVYSGYMSPKAQKLGEVVYLTGAISKTGARPGVVGTLPSGMRPDKQLVFSAGKGTTLARVDITPQGEIRWVTGGNADWLSLDGIAFRTVSTPTLQLASGWADYGKGNYRGAQVFRRDGEVRLSGLVRKTTKVSSGPVLIAKLPRNARPLHRLTFLVNQHNRTSRVDVHPDGRLMLNADDSNPSWISLDGIAFQGALPLFLAWQGTAGDAYGPPRIHKWMQRVRLSGTMSASPFSVKLRTPGRRRWTLLDLPFWGVPRGRLIFFVNAHSSSKRVNPRRVDVDRSRGDLQLVGVTTKQVHLDGISFLGR